MIAAVIAGVAVIIAIAIITIGSSSSRPRASGHGGAERAAVHHGPAAPLKVLAVSPSKGSSGVIGDDVVQLTFSAPVAEGSPWPAITPDVPGGWQAVGTTLTFTPTAPFSPGTKFAIRIPAGRAGVRSANGGLLTRSWRTTFSTAHYSRLRLAELLSQLGYLPLTWEPSAGGRITGEPAGSGLIGQEELAFSPPPGLFSWQPGYPAALHQQWRSGQRGTVIRGAVMAFQAQHRLDINGVASAKFWHALFRAAVAGKSNAVGYTYAIASKGSPETLTIWHDGHQVLRSLANTGIPVAPTASGTYPVYERFRYQVMSGTNPDGSHYADPVSFVSYFDGGEAVHYFPRGSYGSPQSLGCVELPYNDAERAWPYLTYGSLVTVAG